MARRRHPARALALSLLLAPVRAAAQAATVPPPAPAAATAAPPDALTGLDGQAESVTVPLYYYTDAAQVLKILRPDARALNQDAYNRAVGDAQEARTALTGADDDAQAAVAREDAARQQDVRAQRTLTDAQAQAQQASGALYAARQQQAALDQAKASLAGLSGAAPADQGLRARLDAATVQDAQAANTTALAQTASADADAALGTAGANAAGARKTLADAEAEVQAARAGLLAARKAQDLAVQKQLDTQTALAGVSLDYEAAPAPPPAPGDPLQRLYIRTAGASTLFLRGTAHDLRYAREAIAQLDTPVPQARATLWTVQLNSQDARQRRNHLAGLQDSINRVEGQMAVLRDQLSGSVALFQACVQAQVEREDDPAHQGPGWPAGPPAVTLPPVYNFYEPSVLRELPQATYAGRFDRPDLYLSPFRINALGEVLFTLLLATEADRRAALQNYLDHAPQAMALIDDDNSRRQDQPIGAPASGGLKHPTQQELRRRYRDSFQMTELLAAFGCRLERDGAGHPVEYPDPAQGPAGSHFRIVPLAAGPAATSDGVRRQQEYIVSIIKSRLQDGDRKYAAAQLSEIAAQAQAMEGQCADQEARRAALERGRDDLEAQPAGRTQPARREHAITMQERGVNAREQALFAATRAWIAGRRAELEGRAGRAAPALPAEDTEAGVAEALAQLFVDRFGAIKAFTVPDCPDYRLFPSVSTPSPSEVGGADAMRTFVRGLTGEDDAHAALLAIGDQIIKRYVVAAEDDLDAEVIRPRLDGLHSAVADKAIEFGVVTRTSLLAGDRRTAGVDPRADVEYDFPKPPDLLKEALDLAKLVARPAAGGGAAGAALSALAGGGGGLLGSLQDLSARTAQPEPQVYQVQTGSGFTLTPILLPDAQNVAFDLSYTAAAPVTEPADVNGRHVAQVQRHTLHTYVQDGSYELRELTRFESDTHLAQPVIRSGGLPLLRELPVLRDVPLIGWFSQTGGRGDGLQESLIFVHTVQYPTVRNLIPLF